MAAVPPAIRLAGNPGVSDAQLEADAERVRRDLAALKALLEQRKALSEYPQFG
jgi:hypothetical protein